MDLLSAMTPPPVPCDPIKYPSQTVFSCPVCRRDYAIFSSWTRHLKNSHPSESFLFSFVCDTCGETFPSKRAAAQHHAHNHGPSRLDRGDQTESGSFQCHFCGSYFPSKRSCSQHIRNQHPEEASDERDSSAAVAVSRFWSEEDHQLFLDALSRLGPTSNIAIAQCIPSKSAKQVGVHKRIFLRDNPDWLASARVSSTEPESSGALNPVPELCTLIQSSTPEPESGLSVSAFSVSSESPGALNLEPELCTLIQSSTPELESGVPTLVSSPLPSPLQLEQSDDAASCSSASSSSTLTPPTPRRADPSPSSSQPPTPYSQARTFLRELEEQFPNLDSPTLPPAALPSLVSSTVNSPSFSTNPRVNLLERLSSVSQNVTLESPPAVPTTSVFPSSESIATPASQTSITSSTHVNPIPTVSPVSPPLRSSAEEFPISEADPPSSVSVEQVSLLRSALSPFVGRRLSMEDWVNFECLLSNWIDHTRSWWRDSNNHHRPPRNRAAANWRRRHNHRRQQLQQNPQQQQQRTRQLSRRHNRDRAAAAKRLQKFYRSNRRACFGEITGNTKSPPCEISVERLEEYFHQSPTATPSPPPQWLRDHQSAGIDDDQLVVDIFPEEVFRQLQRLPSRSSPGPDKIPYVFWKNLPGAASLLARIYNICLMNNKIPIAWKNSTTTLIYKKGDRDDPGNWRPIALQPTIYKIYAAILARRLAQFCIDNSIISPLQKGFMPVEGCFEHCFLMNCLFEDSKRRRKDLRLLWLDLQNAFGSIPHSVLFDMMSRLSIPPHFINLCKDIYDGSYTRYRCAAGLTTNICQTVGVKQGCPLSPLLFNLALQGLLLGLDKLPGGYSFSSNLTIKYLAYADDLCLVCRTREEVTTFIRCLTEFADWAQLRFKPSKCAILSCINRGVRKYVESFSPTIQGEKIVVMKWGDRYKYLGVPTGRARLQSLENLKRRIVLQVEAVCGSLLTDWQKVDAINTFIISQTTYYLRAACPVIKWVTDLDSIIRASLKRGLSLPRRTISEWFYVQYRQGGLGVFSLADNLTFAKLTQAYRCLDSPDPFVAAVARDQLCQVVSRRCGLESPSLIDLSNYLNSESTCLEISADVKSLWSDLRGLLKSVGLSISFSESSANWKTVSDSSIQIEDAKHFNLILRSHFSSQHLQSLLAAPDQGRSFHLVSKFPCSNSWLRSGSYISFAQYRFAVKARCNLLPVHAVTSRIGRNIQDTNCRRCHSSKETLGHALSSCPTTVGLMRERHNTVLNRLAEAIPKVPTDTLLLDQKIPDSPGQLRPDLCLLRNGTLTMVDVTIPYEGDADAFMKAKREKFSKYKDLVIWARQNFSSVTFHTFIVGTLGAWDSDNDATLRALGLHRRYVPLFRYLTCLDAVKGSLSIWRTFC